MVFHMSKSNHVVYSIKYLSICHLTILKAHKNTLSQNFLTAISPFSLVIVLNFRQKSYIYLCDSNNNR